MPVEPKPLFRPAVLAPRVAAFELPESAEAASEKLASWVELVHGPRADRLTEFDPDRTILRHNLFGVDLNEEAIQICRLSTWTKTALAGKRLTDLEDRATPDAAGRSRLGTRTFRGVVSSKNDPFPKRQRSRPAVEPRAPRRSRRDLVHELLDGNESSAGRHGGSRAGSIPDRVGGVRRGHTTGEDLRPAASMHRAGAS